MSEVPVGRYRELLDQLLQLNAQTAALRRELGAWVLSGGLEVTEAEQQEQSRIPRRSSDQTSAAQIPKILENGLNGKMEANSYPNSSTSTADHAEEVPEKPPEAYQCTTTAVIESRPSPRKINNKTNGQTPSRDGNLNLNITHNDDMERIDCLDDDEDDININPIRKPHFLDEDYHLKKNDVCQIPKPHFLDHSPEEEEERIYDATNPNFLDDKSDIAEDKKSTTSSKTSSNSYQYSQLQYGYSKVRSNEDMCGTSSTQDGNWCSDRDLWQSQDSCSVKSFSSVSSGNAPPGSHQQLGPKVDCVYSLLSLLSLSADSNADMSQYLLDMSHNLDNCIAMRQSGCIPLLVQLIHSKLSRQSKNKAALALHNIVIAQPNDKAGRREVRVLKLLEQVRDYSLLLEDIVGSKSEASSPIKDDMAKHPTQSVAALMKLSFDEEHRHVMCQLGGLQALATLVTVDQMAHGSLVEDVQCVTMRKYSGMALTNLTFGDGNNKALLCSLKDFMIALVDQLQSLNDDMRQVTAAVLRNLSWRADTSSKQILREVGAVKGLTLAAMTGHKEATLKSVLSALWNLTAHCSLNKIDICSVEGALAFLVDMLSYNAPSKTLAIIENAGGILRNVSSHIAIREDYRQILREKDCLKILLQHLGSPSLTIVSNSCGTLWNLSARCETDQQYLCEHGAIPMLRSLIHSKHKMIAMGSSAALKNLLNSKPGKTHSQTLDSTARDLNLPVLPTLGARKQKALEQEIDQNLAETCENIEPTMSPTASDRDEKLLLTAAERHLAMSIEKRRMSSSSPLMGQLASQISMSQSSNFPSYLSCSNTLFLQSSLQKGGVSRTSPGKPEHVIRSDSRDSVASTHSDSVYEKIARNNIKHVNANEKFTHKGGLAKTPSSEKDTSKTYSKINSILKVNPTNTTPRRDYRDFDDQENCDQPIDYSQKYSETKLPKPNEFNERKNGKRLNNSTMPYGNYQETDLDQPTDYSLRYAEDQTELSAETDNREIHEDTMKHFCTEDTPYETPAVFSTATSMSDLRAIAADAPEKTEKVNQPKSEPLEKKKTAESVVADEKDKCSIDEFAKREYPNNAPAEGCSTNINYDSKFSSGIVSPDKPINYCEEGTPGYFSRVSSLSSLEEVDNSGLRPKWTEEEKECNQDENQSYTPPLPEKEDSDKHKTDDIKDDMYDVNGVNFAEETPLMFSRSSSLGSISDVPEQVDDVGSVVSEFSRLTSGCVSPSEIPDSPSQTPPPIKPRSQTRYKNVTPKTNQQQPQHNRLRSVFEDEVATFNCEHTPIEFSTATSLSSLTIDDDVPPNAHMAKLFDMQNRTEGVGSSNPGKTPDRNIPSSFSVSEDNSITGQDILAYCISEGVQSRIKSRMSDLPISKAKSDQQEHMTKDVHPLADTCKSYYTEDTPALQSKVGSHSDLSALSINDDEDNMFEDKECSKKEFSDDSSNTSGGSDHLLAECILSGMPKESSSKSKKQKSPSHKIKNHKQIPPGLPPYLMPKDEVEKYMEEGSPFIHSPMSSLSDLTIDSHGTKARIMRSGIPIPNPKQVNDLSSHYFSSQPRSPASSLSSVSIGSDDDRILDMAIRAGVPQGNGGLTDFSRVKSFNSGKPNDFKSQSSPVHNDEKSEEPVTVLTRTNSLSSLSVESFDSNDGEMALFEQCIKSGMPKAKPGKWDQNMHSKTLDRNFKSRTNNQNSNLPKYHHRNHRSLERNQSEAGTSKREHHEDLMQEAIYCGMPKSKSQKRDFDREQVVPDMSTIRKFDEKKDQDAIASKNGDITSVVVDNNSPSVASNAQTATSDVKNTVNIGNIDHKEGRADSIQDLARATAIMSLNETVSSSKQSDTETDLERQLLNGSVCEESIQLNSTMRDGFDDSGEDRPDGNKLPKLSLDLDDSIFDKSNECQALEVSGILNDSIFSNTADSDQSNESCAKLEDSENKNLAQSVVSCSSYKFVNQTEEDLAFDDSISEKTNLDRSEKQSSTDTWNENTCPNDITFPTVSGTVPMIASFKSDLGDEVTCAGALPDLLEESVVLNESSQPDLTNELVESSIAANDRTPTVENVNITVNIKLNSLSIENLSNLTSMTNSTIIENEAARIVNRLSQQMTDSEHSYQSLDLDHIRPPSQMDSILSLTQSVSGNWIEDRTPQLSPMLSRKNRSSRKKSLPVSLMIKRTVNQSISYIGSSEHLTTLDNIKPPSEMEDLLDMENSMISVASIVSEVAEMPRINFDLKQPINGHHLMPAFTNIDIDAINPPSLFDEMTESTLEDHTEQPSIVDECQTHTLAHCENLPSGSESESPLPSDNKNSSAESTPKKLALRKMTPKQKRQLASERYKTYTIDIESDQTTESLNSTLTQDLSTEEQKSVDTPPPSENILPKRVRSNPKQRRQEDRARYQTQTVIAPNFSLAQSHDSDTTVSKDPKIEELRRRLSAKKSMKERRMENLERYKTQTLDSGISTSSEVCSSGSEKHMRMNKFNSPIGTHPFNHSQFAEDATKALLCLQQQSLEDSLFDIDCETMSLVSNEDDSELNSLRMRTFTKSFRNYLPVIESPTAVDKCIEKNLENINRSQLLSDPQPEVDEFNSLEYDQNSGTESADQNQYSDSEVESLVTKGKPRIIKPGQSSSLDEKATDSDEGIGKAIRGRKKAAYVSPYKKNAVANRKSPSRPNKPTKVVTGSKTIGNKSQTVSSSLKTTLNKVGRTLVGIKTKETNKSPVDSSKPAIVRQGTFTKEESTVLPTAVCANGSLESKPGTKLVKPGSIVKTVVNVSPSRLPHPIGKSNLTKSAVNKAYNSENKAGSSTKFQNGKSGSSSLKNSLSNQSLKSNDSVKTITLKNGTVNKCGSSSSINSSCSSSGVANKPPSKDVTSKIASLWKRVEESKKQASKPDKRIWITNETSPSEDEPPSQPGKLIRSSTFEAPPKNPAAVPATPKQKSSIAIRVTSSPVYGGRTSLKTGNERVKIPVSNAFTRRK